MSSELAIVGACSAESSFCAEISGARLLDWLACRRPHSRMQIFMKTNTLAAAAIKFRLEQPNAMYDGHDWWMSALKARSERMARR
jgi:hypothetical protein